MDKELQKVILRIINDNNGVAEWRLIREKANRIYWKSEKAVQPEVIIKHQLDLLEKEDEIIRKEQLPNIDYLLTPKGHRIFEPLHKRAIYFILYDRHNLFTVLTIIISILSLIVSIIAITEKCETCTNPSLMINSL